MRIQRKDSASYRPTRLNLCEVEVLSCPSRKWGYDPSGKTVDCSKDCGNCKNNKCTVSSGHCREGCVAGWWGLSTGSNGVQDCTNQCSSTCTLCDAITGTQCNYLCIPGYYGIECASPCPCSVGKSCNAVSGACTDECLPGYWGPDCSSRCYCLGTENCNRLGNCPNGCALGYWGEGCSFACSCQGRACNAVNGECVCPVGFWGTDCGSECHCLHADRCNVNNGMCPGGCAIGYWGASCSEECNCASGTCNTTGYCSSGCLQGYGGAGNRQFSEYHEYYIIIKSMGTNPLL